MTWRVFAGEYGDELLTLVRYRCHNDGREVDEETVGHQLHLHLHRGVGNLVGDPRVTNIAGLAVVGLDQRPAA